MNTKIKNKIINHAKKESPLEACGFIVEKNGDIDVIECQNIAKDPQNNFKISSKDYLINKNLYEILYIYHSHEEEEEFSVVDKICSEEIKIDMILYIINKNMFKHYTPNNSRNLKYIGRNINFQNTNCFDLVTKFYKEELNIELKFPKHLNDKNKLEATKRNFSELLEYINPNNMIYLENPEIMIKNDILLFNIDDHFHFAIYLGNNKILEQPGSAFSRIRDYSNFFNRKRVGLFRRKSNGTS